MQLAEHWDTAQVYEADHWTRFIENCKEGGERHWLDLWAPQAELIVRILTEAQRMHTYMQVLEIGGGAIGHIRWFRHGELVAIDPLGAIFEREFPDLDLEGYDLRSDVEYIGYRAEDISNTISDDFDVVLILNALDHCDSPLRVMSEIKRVIRPNGWLFESTTVFTGGRPQDDHEYSKMHPHIFMGQRSLLKFMESCGFLQVDVPMTQEWVGESGPLYDQVLHVWRKER